MFFRLTPNGEVALISVFYNALPIKEPSTCLNWSNTNGVRYNLLRRLLMYPCAIIINFITFAARSKRMVS